MRPFAIAISMVAVPAAAFAASDGAQRGQKLAREQCAQCHNISKEPSSNVQRAPTFRDIARSPLNANQWVVYLAFGHSPMGAARLAAISPGDAGDIASYIVTLRPH